jgi:deazaflavin-dependent oxidoreductase (nitroreductase family)
MAKIGLMEKIYNRVESFLMDKLVSQDTPGPIFKWVFKIPILQYKLGLGWLTGNYVLLLTTTGRKTGKKRYTPLEYLYDKENDRYRIAAGWGGKTDWFRNIKADPHVHVQVGRREFDAVAEIASDKEVAEYMMMVSSRHPRMDKVWNRWSDKPVDGTLESYIRAAKYFPSVWLKPLK